jgi:hypothetical protein
MNSELPVGARGTRDVKVRRLTTATGPVESCLDEPHILAMKPGIEA